MKTLRFEGYSDDTFGEYAVTSDDHDNCASGAPIRYRIEAGDEAMVVVGQHATAGTGGWLIGVAPAYTKNGDDKPIPQWPMRFERGEREYTPALLVEVPDDFKLVCMERDDEGEDEG